MRLDHFFLVISSSCKTTLKTNYSLGCDLSVPGDYGGGATPLPIPNRVVKPSSADGTAPVAGWKSKSSPGLLFKKVSLVKVRPFFLANN